MTRIRVELPLRWSDFDAYQHVNNAEMFRLLEEARIQAFWKPAEGQEARPSAVLEAGPGAEVISLIARQEIEYLLPIPYQRAPIEAEIWIGRLGGASLEICYELYSPVGVEPRVLYTRAATTLVTVVAGTGRPTRVDDTLRAAWEPYLENPVVFSSRR